jgi:hypothetical protein
MAGLGGRPFSMGSYVSVIHVQGRLEQEFAKDGTTVDWHFYSGAGPAVPVHAGWRRSRSSSPAIVCPC